MPSSPWRYIAGIGATGVEGRVLCDSISRTNNTIHVNNFRAQIRPSGGSFYDTDMRILGQFPNGSTRVNDFIGDRNVGGTITSYYNDFSFGVGSSTTSSNWQAGFGDYTGNYWASVDGVDIPNAGSPSLDMPTVTLNSPTSVTFRGHVNSWGANCTAGAGVRFGYNDFTGGTQQYTGRTTDSTPTSTVSVSSNASLFVDIDAVNGAGRTADSSNRVYQTAPLAATMGTPDVEAVTAVIPTTQNNGDGHYSITRQYRLKKNTDAYGSWTTFSGDDMNLSGLLPSTEYTVQIRSQTSAGTTTGGTTTFTTKPAVKIVYIDGTVKDAIPHIIRTDGTVEMVKIEQII